MTVSNRGRNGKEKATRLCSQIVRSKGKCERCGDTDSPHDHAHIIRRTYAATRTDEQNGWCLCKKCHYMVDNFGDEFAALVVKTLGWDGYMALKKKALDGVRVKMDWPAEVERLKAL